MAILQTRIVNVSGAGRPLFAPYKQYAEAGQAVFVADPISVVSAYINQLPPEQQAWWRASVASATTPPSLTAQPFDFASQRGINLGAPVNPSDAATKVYVDSRIVPPAPPPPAPTSVTMGGDLAGQSNAASVVKLCGLPVSDTPPIIGQVLGWNGESVVWVDGGGGAAATFDVIVEVAESMAPGVCAVILPDGRVVRANPTDPTRMQVFGIVTAAPAEGWAVVQYQGDIEGLYETLTPGFQYVGLDGRLTATVPSTGVVLRVALAISAKRLIIQTTGNATLRG